MSSGTASPGSRITDAVSVDRVHACGGNAPQLAQEVRPRPIERGLEDEARAELAILVQYREAAEVQTLDLVEGKQ